MRRIIALGLPVLLLVGCSAPNVPASEPETVESETSATPTMPDLVGMTLDAAHDALDELGLSIDATDAVNDRIIVLESNWTVVEQGICHRGTARSRRQRPRDRDQD